MLRIYFANKEALQKHMFTVGNSVCPLGKLFRFINQPYDLDMIITSALQMKKQSKIV